MLLSMTRILYGFPFSANSYRVRLFLALLGVPYEERVVDLVQGEHRRAPFTDLNPLGQVPVLDDDGRVLCDSHAIVVHLARRYGESWLPSEALPEILHWLFFDATELHHGVGLARNHHAFRRSVDIEPVTRRARAALDVLERQLRERDWLELARPSLADVACYPFVAVLDDARLDVTEWPRVSAWAARIEALPGFIAMPRFPRR
jgi:glutathione S-transferase